MNMGKTFVERNEKRINFITSYFFNTQTTVNSRDVARLERKQAMPASKSVCLLQVLLKAHFVIFHVNINNNATKFWAWYVQLKVENREFHLEARNGKKLKCTHKIGLKPTIYINSLYARQLKLLKRTYPNRHLDNGVATDAMRVRTSPRLRKATVIMVKHRAASLTYRSTLTRFGHNPSMETMLSVRAALKELYVLEHIIDVI